ncbi:MAG TPA: ZIP family metal transporter [Anaerolineales bacterium]|nr:ZIP family metal transporter [Anaerolineales bacterium]
MNFIQTVLLGAIAGFTIYLGLPIGRIKGLTDKTRAFLSMTSAGILIFLFFDIFGQVAEPVEEALNKANFSEFFPLLGIFILGFGAGLLGLILFEQRVIRARKDANQALSPARLALLIASGIGLHNFSEGLAIGQSAGSGEIAFAAILIIGFGLHNATEGFGIVGPMAGKERPSWAFLGLLGLIGGGPTFLGTMVGYYFVSTAMSVLFLSLAAGALVYIIGELFQANWKAATKIQASWGILAGFLFALITDLVLVYAGA